MSSGTSLGARLNGRGCGEESCFCAIRTPEALASEASDPFEAISPAPFQCEHDSGPENHHPENHMPRDHSSATRTPREHRLGGAGTVRLARASKTAIDLVRTTLVPSAGDGQPRGATR